jgi:hypothetical protein
MVAATPLLGHSQHLSHQRLYDHTQSNRAHGHGRDRLSVKEVRNPGFRPPAFSSGPAALRQTYLKYNIPVPRRGRKSTQYEFER